MPRYDLVVEVIDHAEEPVPPRPVDPELLSVRGPHEIGRVRDDGAVMLALDRLPGPPVGAEQVVFPHQAVDARLAGHQGVHLSFLHAFLHFHVPFSVELVLLNFRFDLPQYLFIRVLGFPAPFSRSGNGVFIPGATAVTDHFKYQAFRVWLARQRVTFLYQHRDHFLLSFAANSFFFFVSSSSICSCPILRSAAPSLESSGFRLNPVVPFSMNWSLQREMSERVTPCSRLSNSGSSPRNKDRTISVLIFDVIFFLFPIAVVKITFIFYCSVYLRANIMKTISKVNLCMQLTPWAKFKVETDGGTVESVNHIINIKLEFVLSAHQSHFR